MKPGYKKPHPLMQVLMQGRALGSPFVPFVAMGRVGKTRARRSTHWLTAYGVFMRPDQMTHEHKLNCVRMIARGKRIRAAMLMSAFDALQYAKNAPDHASDAASEEAAELIDAKYADRVAFAAGHMPVIGQMVMLLRLNGLDPYVDYGRELYDGEARQRLDIDVVNGVFRPELVPRAIEDSAPSIYDEGIGT